MAIGLCVPAFASEQTEFYDADGNMIDTQYDGANGAYNSNYLYKHAYDGGCAVINNYSGSPTTGSTIYSCNGGCSRFSSSSYNIVEILPNGSYFHGYGRDAYDEGNTGSYNFICSASGEWVACQTRTNTSSGEPALVKEVGLRTYCSTGYKEANVGGDEDDFLNVSASEFCGDPYYYWESSTNYFASWIRVAQNCSETYNYDGCASGYKLSTDQCVSCGSLMNGGYNKPEWHRLTSCNAYCDSGYGYKASTGTCEAGAMGQLHMYNYYGEENDWRDCPDGALCDVDGYMWCPVGSFVAHAGDGSATPWCADCPGEWGMAQAYAAGLGDDGYMEWCGGFDYGWGQGEDTDCMWTDVWATMDEMESGGVCYEFRGSDNTGSYEYRYDDGDWYDCSYEQ